MSNVPEEVKKDVNDVDVKVILPGSGASKIPKRKLDYGERLKSLLDEFKTCLVVDVTNVGSAQVAQLRRKLRGRARFIFGKNTMIRKVIRDYVKKTGNQKFMALMDIAKGNTGFCFTKENVSDMRKLLITDKKQCAAKPGIIAPVDVWVQPGPTGMEPTQTGFFQSMNIPTRINRGQIDITDPVQVVFKGTKVGQSEANLLSKLGVKPFFYGCGVTDIYEDGNAYSAKILDITDDDIGQSLFHGLRNIAALSFTLNYPTIATVPHSLINSYKKVVSFALTACPTYSWEGLENIKETLKNPNKFANVTSNNTGGGGGAAKPEPSPEPSPSPEAAPGLFGDSDSDSDSDE